MTVSTCMPLGAQTFLAIKCFVWYCIMCGGWGVNTFINFLLSTVLGFLGARFGIQMGMRELDDELLRQFPDGNAAKFILAKRGLGEFPKPEYVF